MLAQTFNPQNLSTDQEKQHKADLQREILEKRQSEKNEDTKSP